MSQLTKKLCKLSASGVPCVLGFARVVEVLFFYDDYHEAIESNFTMFSEPGFLPHLNVLATRAH